MKGKYEKLAMQYHQEGEPDFGKTHQYQDFAIYLDKRREEKKPKWINNTGIRPDLPEGTKVEIKHRCGSREIREFQEFRWNLNNGQGDIIKYRVVK